jgi:hypothetical protein
MASSSQNEYDRGGILLVIFFKWLIFVGFSRFTELILRLHGEGAIEKLEHVGATRPFGHRSITEDFVAAGDDFGLNPLNARKCLRCCKQKNTQHDELFHVALLERLASCRAITKVKFDYYGSY